MSSKSSKSCWVFDVDGVLADTREAVREAYRIAGVIQPDDVWGLSWELWLPALAGPNAHDVHEEKQYFYPKLLEEGKAQRLAGADFASALVNAGHHVYFVTAASQRSAEAVIASVGLDIALLWDSELSSSKRHQALHDIALEHIDAASYTYIDDRLEGGDVASAAGFAFIHAPWMQ